jgi:hypothetical protein
MEGFMLARIRFRASGGVLKWVKISRSMKNTNVVRNYYVLPCCLLLLNLCVELVSYKAKVFGDPFLRTGAIMAMVLFGGSLVGFVVAPAFGKLVGTMQRSSRQGGGELGEIFFLLLLGAIVFWLYYRIYIIGPESVLPAEWHNPKF